MTLKRSAQIGIVSDGPTPEFAVGMPWRLAKAGNFNGAALLVKHSRIEFRRTFELPLPPPCRRLAVPSVRQESFLA